MINRKYKLNKHVLQLSPNQSGERGGGRGRGGRGGGRGGSRGRGGRDDYRGGRGGSRGGRGGGGDRRYYFLEMLREETCQELNRKCTHTTIIGQRWIKRHIKCSIIIIVCFRRDRYDPYERKSSRYEEPYGDPYASRGRQARDPYADDPYLRDPYARDPYADPYVRDPYRDPYARDPYARDPYARPPPDYYSRMRDP